MQSTSFLDADTSDLSIAFEIFCTHVFSSRKDITKKIENKEIDYKTLHKSLSLFLKTTLENETSSLNKDLKDIVYAMAAICDEVFLNMDWEGKQYWEENILENRYFGTQIAGDKIFEIINELLTERETLSTKKAEIYLKILSLGFKGKYRGMENEQIQIGVYRKRLFEFIEKNDKSMFLIGHRLFQKEYTHTLPTIHRKLLPDASIINYISAFFVFMFFVISSVVWIFETRDIRQLLNEISSIALRE
ncbi:MAG: DotU family type IV/VI secretion system protein [Holosporaceae bacterium]|nr:DotU family type IV/VI secretion system protein [Holosporaceae bacterium]